MRAGQDKTMYSDVSYTVLDTLPSTPYTNLAIITWCVVYSYNLLNLNLRLHPDYQRSQNNFFIILLSF